MPERAQALASAQVPERAQALESAQAPERAQALESARVSERAQALESARVSERAQALEPVQVPLLEAASARGGRTRFGGDARTRRAGFRIAVEIGVRAAAANQMYGREED